MEAIRETKTIYVTKYKAIDGTTYTTKQACIDLAKTKNIELCMRIWSAAICAWIYE